jgi:hypothetical protein
MSEPRIDTIRALYDSETGKVHLRCYTGKNFTDAAITAGCALNLCGDLAKIGITILQETMAKVPMQKVVD